MDTISVGIVLIIMVLLLAVLAGVSDNLGKVLAIVMGGFLLGWCLNESNSKQLKAWVDKLQSGSAESSK